MAVPFSNTKLRVPKGFQNILEGLAREVLRSQPNDLFEFGAKHFEKLLQGREETGHDPAIHGAKLDDRFYNNDSFKNPSVDASNPQQQAAAVTIQSQYRQHTAQEEADKLRKEKEEEEVVDIDLNDPEVADAAAKIQAGFRGYQTRKGISNKANSENTAPNATEPVSQTTTEPTSEKNNDLDTELADIDLNDPELAQAATKIQAGFRGHVARKQLPSKPSEGQEEATENKTQDAEEEIDIDLNDPEVAQAATKIQAGFRGHKARKELKQQDERQEETENKQEEAEEEIDIDLNDPEVAQAATRIQAGFRGHKARKELNQQQQQQQEDNNDEIKEEEANEEIDIDLNDPEVALAATKIQAGFRGHKARKELNQQQQGNEKVTENKQEEEEIDIDLNDPEVAQAATKIQAGFRGHKARKELNQQQQETPSSETKTDETENKPKEAEEEIDIDLNDPEVAQAATKIQAGFRGHKARKELQQEKDKPLEPSAQDGQVGEVTEGEAPKAQSDKKAEEEEIDIDLEDPDVANAALKIQANFKGFKTRKALRSKDKPLEPSAQDGQVGEVTEEEAPKAQSDKKAEEEEIDIDLEDPDVAHAALKIQANFKGFKTRKALRSKTEAPPTGSPAGDATEVKAETVVEGENQNQSGAEKVSSDDPAGQSAEGKPSTESKPEEEEVDIDLNDPEVAAAATKIQASFRGHKTRQDLKTTQAEDNSPQDTAGEVQETAPESLEEEPKPTEASTKDEPSEEQTTDS